MKDKMPISIIKESDPDYDPNLIIQTGKVTYDIEMINLLLQESISATASMGYINHADFLDNTTEFEKAGSADSTFPELKDDDTPFLSLLEKMAAGSWTCIRKAVYGGAWPTFPTIVADVTGNGAQIFALAYYQFKRGLLGENWYEWSTDDTNGVPNDASDAHDAACGLSWSDRGAGTHDLDYMQICRFAYAFGLSMQEKFPDLSIRIESTNNATVVERNIEVLFLLFPIAMIQYYYLAAMQSDVAVFNLAGLQDGLTNKKVPSEIFNAVDAAWQYFVDENKYDVLGSEITGYNTYTADFIGHALVEATTIDNAIHDWKTKFRVSGWALSKARTLWGIGKYEGSNETVHFMNLLNGVLASSGGSYDTHGATTWELGLNLSIGLDFLSNCETLAKDFDLFVKKKNYTWSEVNSVYADFFTEFSVLDSLKGFCEPEAYRPLRRTTFYTDTPDATTGWRADPGANDPEVLFTDDSDTVLTGATTQPWPSEWVYLFLHKYIPNWYRLHFPFDWNDQEIYNMFFFGMMLDTGASVDVAFDVSCDRWTSTKIRLVEMINAKKPETVICLAVGDNAETPRMEDVPDKLDTTNYETIAFKYACELIDRVPTNNISYTGPRPHGWVGASATLIENIGHRDVAMQLLINTIGLRSGKPTGSKGKPQTDEKPDQNTIGDGPDGEIR